MFDQDFGNKQKEVTIALITVSIISTRSSPDQKFSLNIQNLLRNLDELKWIFLDCWLNGFLFSQNKYDWFLPWHKLHEGWLNWYSVLLYMLNDTNTILIAGMKPNFVVYLQSVSIFSCINSSIYDNICNSICLSQISFICNIYMQYYIFFLKIDTTLFHINSNFD